MTGLVFSYQKSVSYSIRIYVNGTTKRVDYELALGRGYFTFTKGSKKTSGNTYIDIGDVVTNRENHTDSYFIGNIRITLYTTDSPTNTDEGVTLYIPLEQDYLDKL